MRALLLLGQLAVQAPDTTSVFKAARRAELEYESSIRRHAPASFAAPRGDCDEHVGRFCVHYESGRDSLPTEPPRVATARDTAIAALGRAAALAPDRNRFVYPLVRFLSEAGRSPEAVEVARAYARVRGEGPESHMLLGFALHADRQTGAALESFERWLALLPERERLRINEIRMLLDDSEARAYRRLTDQARRDYAERAWRFADPLFLTNGNELRSDHYARHAVIRMLAERGASRGESWGYDLEELTIRFAVPVRTTKSWRPGAMGNTEEYSDHWDPALRTFFPPDLRRALATEPRLDSIWPLDTLTSRSGHAPPTIRAMRVLEGQVVTFADEVRFYGVVRVDTLVKGAQGGLFLLDSALNLVNRGPLRTQHERDSIMVHGSVALRGSARFYSAEVYDTLSLLAARSRFRFDLPAAMGALQLSGILLAQPFEPGRLPEERGSMLLKPLTRPVVGAGTPIGIYAEVSSSLPEPTSAQLELEVTGLSRGSAITRAAGWIGRALGISQARTPTRLGWSIELAPARTTAVPVTLDLGAARPGVYQVKLTVRDAAGATVVAKRDLLITSGNSSSRRP